MFFTKVFNLSDKIKITLTMQMNVVRVRSTSIIIEKKQY